MRNRILHLLKVYSDASWRISKIDLAIYLALLIHGPMTTGDLASYLNYSYGHMSSSLRWMLGSTWRAPLIERNTDKLPYVYMLSRSAP